jgi:hypothetical protein
MRPLLASLDSSAASAAYIITTTQIIMNIQKLTKLALAGLIFAGLCFATGCEKQPEDKAADAIEDAGDAVRDATN